VAQNQGLVRERGSNAIDPLMGILMARVRGRADGRIVHEILRRAIEKSLEGSRRLF
jgi:Glu-tRNA(Gln) amidotransferase subunit E-like FAD-binding protein